MSKKDCVVGFVQCDEGIVHSYGEMWGDGRECPKAEFSINGPDCYLLGHQSAVDLVSPVEHCNWSIIGTIQITDEFPQATQIKLDRDVSCALSSIIMSIHPMY